LKSLRAIGIILLMGLGVTALATETVALVGNAAHGQTLTTTCVTCHGADGKGLSPVYPNLAGQDQAYLLMSLQEFKKGPAGHRNNPIMGGMVAALADQDMADVAAYYASQPAVKGGEADPTLVEAGQRLYRGGNGVEGIPACSACHGPRGEGNALSHVPRLSGQNADYIVAQLKAYQEGTRSHPMMDGVVHHMTTKDMQAVASYIQGLH
jgi:cytochrome c553